jgi:short-subunit dehydrogenase
MERGWVLITGASSGIGAGLARLFAADGHPLVLVARRENRLRALAKSLPVETRVMVHDLADPQAAEHVEHYLHVQNIKLQTLVNNAGFGKRRRFLALDLRTQLDMVQLNITTLMELTHRLLPDIIERGGGGVLNVASLAGLQPGPNMAVYYATKAFILHFSEALREELIDRDVTVTAFCPGPVATEFGTVADTLRTPLYRFGAMSCERATEIAYRGYRSGRAVILPGFLPRLVSLLVRITPRSWTRKLVKRLQPGG